MNTAQLEDNRFMTAVNLWLAMPDPGEEERAAWEAIFWDPARWTGSAWCAAWAARVDAVANGGTSEEYARRYGSSCSRRTGRGPRPLPGPEYKPTNAYQTARPGSIITVHPNTREGDTRKGVGSHCTILVERLDRGVLCIGGNQGPGWRVDGARRLGDVVVSFYRWRDLRHTVSIPPAEYPRAEWVGPKAVTAAQEALRANTRRWQWFENEAGPDPDGWRP